MTMYSRLLGTAIVLASSGGAAWAETTSLPAILDQQVALRADVLEGNGAFKDMSKSQRKELAERQSSVIETIRGKQSIGDLDERQKTAVFNDLELIKATVAKAEDERIICERTRATGSNRTTRVCSTVAERRLQREGAEKLLGHRTLYKGET